MGGAVKKATNSVTKGFKKVTKEVISTPIKQISKEVGRLPKNIGGTLDGGGGSDNTVIQQAVDKDNQRYASEEGQTTEQGATDLKSRLFLNSRKKINRLSTTKK